MAVGYEDSNWDHDRGSIWSGECPRMSLSCHDCKWRTSSASAIAAVAAAQAHHRATGHAISYKGTVQETWQRRTAMSPRVRPHHHPCRDCKAPTECAGEWESNPDGFPEAICREYHEPGGTTNYDFVCDACHEKRVAAAAAPQEIG